MANRITTWLVTNAPTVLQMIWVFLQIVYFIVLYATGWADYRFYTLRTWVLQILFGLALILGLLARKFLHFILRGLVYFVNGAVWSVMAVALAMTLADANFIWHQGSASIAVSHDVFVHYVPPVLMALTVYLHRNDVRRALRFSVSPDRRRWQRIALKIGYYLAQFGASIVWLTLYVAMFDPQPIYNTPVTRGWWFLFGATGALSGNALLFIFVSMGPKETAQGEQDAVRESIDLEATGGGRYERVAVSGGGMDAEEQRQQRVPLTSATHIEDDNEIDYHDERAAAADADAEDNRKL